MLANRVVLTFDVGTGSIFSSLTSSFSSIGFKSTWLTLFSSFWIIGWIGSLNVCVVVNLSGLSKISKLSLLSTLFSFKSSFWWFNTSSFIPKSETLIKLDDLIESKNHFKLFDYMLDYDNWNE